MRRLALIAAAVAVGSAPGLSYVRDGWIAVRGHGRLVRGESPAWSPDGKRLAFARGGELFLIRSDGTGERGLARKAKIWWEDRTPTWPPDGRRIAFASNRAGFFNQELYAIGVDGRGIVGLRTSEGRRCMSSSSRRAARPRSARATRPAWRSRGPASSSPRAPARRRR